MNAEDIRKLADEQHINSVVVSVQTEKVLRVCADLYEASKAIRGQCDLSDWHFLDDSLAKLEAIAPSGEKSLSQKLRDAGYTRRPKHIPDDDE